VFGFNPATKPELDRLMAPFFICRPKSEVLASLPPVVYSVRRVEMEPKQAKAYASMADHMLVHSEGDILVAPDPLVKLTRLRQIACGLPILEVDEEGEPQVVALAEPSCKVDALLDLVDEMAGKPLVVFAESKLLLRLCSEVLTKKKVEHVAITGDVDAAQRAANVARFQTGVVPVILVSLGAGAEGITLTASDTAVFLQRSYRMVANRQAEARIHRIGQEASSVQIIDIITDGTIEGDVFDISQEKEEVLNQITKDPAWVRRVLTKGAK
jgi:SNF2 family DNA or RNA helicase